MKNRRIGLAICLSLFIFLISHIDSYAKDYSITVKPSDEAAEYLKELDPYFGTLCYDLYKIYDKKDAPNDLYKNPYEYAKNALEQKVGPEGTFVNESTKAAYSGLMFNTNYEIEDAIYLMVVRGTKPDTTVVKPVTIANSDMDDNSDYQTGLVTYSLLGYHMYTVTPLLVANEGEITLKMEVDPEIGSLRINKNIKKYYADVENTTFVFQVDIYFPEENTLFSSEVYAFNFDSTGTKSLLVDGIPIGSTVKVSEIYKGLSYETYVGDDKNNSVTTQITGKETAQIDFENKYTPSTNYGGGGIVNRFEFGTNNGGWQWTQLKGNETSTNGKKNVFLEKLYSKGEE